MQLDFQMNKINISIPTCKCSDDVRCWLNGFVRTGLLGVAPKSLKWDNCSVSVTAPSSTTVTIAHNGSKMVNFLNKLLITW